MGAGGKEGKKTRKKSRELLKISLQGQLSLECIWVFKVPTHAEHQKPGLGPSPILTGLSQGLLCDTEGEGRAVPLQGW